MYLDSFDQSDNIAPRLALTGMKEFHFAGGVLPQLHLKNVQPFSWFVLCIVQTSESEAFRHCFAISDQLLDSLRVAAVGC